MCWSRHVYIPPTRRPMTPTPPTPYWGAQVGSNDTTRTFFTDVLNVCNVHYKACNISVDGCLNGGTCCALVDNPLSTRCICTAEFTGDFCERHNDDVDNAMGSTSGASLNLFTVLIIVGIILVACLVILGVCLVKRSRRRNRPAQTVDADETKSQEMTALRKGPRGDIDVDAAHQAPYTDSPSFTNGTAKVHDQNQFTASAPPPVQGHPAAISPSSPVSCLYPVLDDGHRTSDSTDNRHTVVDFRPVSTDVNYNSIGQKENSGKTFT